MISEIGTPKLGSPRCLHVAGEIFGLLEIGVFWSRSFDASLSFLGVFVGFFLDFVLCLLGCSTSASTSVIKARVGPSAIGESGLKSFGVGSSHSLGHLRVC